jgi:hypothetical protein
MSVLGDVSESANAGSGAGEGASAEWPRPSPSSARPADSTFKVAMQLAMTELHERSP